MSQYFNEINNNRIKENRHLIKTNDYNKILIEDIKTFQDKHQNNVSNFFD